MKCKGRKILLMILGITPLLFSCNPTEGNNNGNNNNNINDDKPKVEERTLDFYALNDFHGAYLYNENYSQTGLSRIGKFLKDKKALDPENTFIISSGDMFQGGAESNITYGDVVIDTMNEIDFDSMTIGNHEFDWGEERLRHMESKMNFPLLGYNIYYVSDNSRPSYLKPSTIIQREGIKVGIIGSIAPNVGSDIIATISSNFSYPDVEDKLKEEAVLLRNKGCDVVVLSAHDGQYLNYASLSEPYNDQYRYVDAVFLGHDHKYRKGNYDNVVPYVEGGCNGNYVANIKLNLKLNKSTNRYVVDSYSQDVMKTFDNSNFQEEDETINNIYGGYKEQIESIRDEVLFTFDTTVSRADFGRYMSKAFASYVNESDEFDYHINAGIINSGGVRSDIAPGQFTYGDLIKVYPFENALTIMEMDSSDFEFYKSTTVGYTYIVDEVNTKGKYYIATNDYFAYLQLEHHKNIKLYPYTNYLIRDIVSDYLKEKGYVNA